jgi:histidinol-phosphate phosphatase family protein
VLVNNKKAPAVFLDRDGTIIEDRGHLSRPAQVRFFPQAFRALQMLRQRCRLFIITNQPGIARGIISLHDAESVNNHVLATLAEKGIDITDLYMCPHQRTDNCPCIKPKPFFLRRAEKRCNIDLPASFVIGDHPHDIRLAENVAARGIYVLTGHGRKHAPELPPKPQTAPDILHAAKIILACPREATP